jgi:hypothetical protein
MAKMSKTDTNKAKSRARNDDDDDDDDEVTSSKSSKTMAKSKSKSSDDDDDDDEVKTKASSDDDNEDDDTGNSDDADVDDDDDDDDDEVFNLADADENAVGGEIVPAGKYVTEITDCEFKEFSTGNKGALFTLEVTKGKYAKGDKRKNGKRFYVNLVATAKNVNMMRAYLKAFGVSKKVYSSPEFRLKTLRDLVESGDLIGNEVVAMVTIRAYEGNKRNEVKRVMLPSAESAEGADNFMDDE